MQGLSLDPLPAFMECPRKGALPLPGTKGSYLVIGLGHVPAGSRRAALRCKEYAIEPRAGGVTDWIRAARRLCSIDLMVAAWAGYHCSGCITAIEVAPLRTVLRVLERRQLPVAFSSYDLH